MIICRMAAISACGHRLPDLRHRGHGRGLAAAGRAAPQAARQLPQPTQLATCSTAVLGTMLICANQTIRFAKRRVRSGQRAGLCLCRLYRSGGRRRLRSKAISSIFQGLPSSMIYIGVLSLAIYALVGHTVVL